MAPSGSRIVTPEAVELDLDAAGLASRFLAALLDLLVMLIILYAVLGVGGVLAQVSSSTGDDTGGILAAVIVLFGTFAVLLLWPTAWEVATKGRSIGKLALGLRVVTIEGAPIRLRHALVRGLTGLVEILFTLGVVAVVVALGSRRFRRLGDHLAGTVVIRERGAGADRATPRRFIPYPGWEAWSARLDATRLTADDYRLVRTFLLRSSSLPLEVRGRLGLLILTRVLRQAGIDPHVAATLGAWSVEAPLVAVAAAYQRRFDPVAPV
jgi:uncharacterized RDD family membrane protein YckC